MYCSPSLGSGWVRKNGWLSNSSTITKDTPTAYYMYSTYPTWKEPWHTTCKKIPPPSRQQVFRVRLAVIESLPRFLLDQTQQEVREWFRGTTRWTSLCSLSLHHRWDLVTLTKDAKPFCVNTPHTIPYVFRDKLKAEFPTPPGAKHHCSSHRTYQMVWRHCSCPQTRNEQDQNVHWSLSPKQVR